MYLLPSVINEEQAKEIKIMLKTGMRVEKISRKFQVSHKIILRINNGETWEHVEV